VGWLTDVYMICAIVGGTLLVLQTILIVVGGGGDHDLGIGPDHDIGGGDHGLGHDGGDLTFIKWLSVKTVVAALTFFGLAGLAAEKAGLAPMPSLLIALVAGGVAVVAVGFLMASLSRLQSKGNVDLARNAVGTVGTVYLRVPGSRQGQGKVTLVLQGRTVEVAATTTGPELPTGSEVRVVAVPGPELVDVTAL
jgi:hypothetical protein